MNEEPLSHYEFGPFRLNVTERLLHRNDELVPMKAKLIDTLIVLVVNQGHVVTKDELMQILWPDTFVEENSLTQSISLLRKALAGENGNGQQYIETIPKRGYRFIVPTPDIEHAVSNQQQNQLPFNKREGPGIESAKLKLTRQTNTLAISAGCILLIAAVGFLWFRHERTTSERPEAKSLAVLPFRTLGTKGENEQLGLGMADAVIVRLSKLRRLSVLPTTSVFRYAERASDPLVAGQELEVNVILDGTIQRAEGRTRITVDLIDVDSKTVLWSSKFDEKNSNIFDLQDSVAEQVAKRIATQISVGERAQITKHFTDIPEAFDSYQMGLYFWNKRTKENLAKAIMYFEQAVERDSNFSRAYAFLADCYAINAYNGYGLVPAAETWPRTYAAATKALDLDETVAETHMVLAFIKAANKDFLGAEREHQRALELDPNLATGRLRYGYDLFNRLRLNDAVDEITRAQELDPLSPINNSALCFVLTKSRNYDLAITYGRRAIELDPQALAARQNLAEAYAGKGMFQEMIELLDGPPRRDAVIDQLYLAYALAKTGKHQKASEIMIRTRRLLDTDKTLIRSDRDIPYTFAISYLALGQKETAFEWLRKVDWDRFMIAKLNFDPLLDQIRSDPSFDRFFSGRSRE